MLASSTYTKRRGSISSHNDSDSDGDDDEQRGYLPMTIDTNIVPGLSQNSATLSDSASQTPDRQGLSASRDYFVPRASTIIHRDMMRLSEPGSPRSPGTDGDSISNHTKSHVAFQEKGRSLQRTTSAANTPAESHTTSPSHIAAMDIMNRMHQNDASRDAFRLRDAPATRSRKNSAKSNQTPLFSRQEQLSPRTTAGPMLDTNAGLPESGRDSPDSGINPFDDPKLLDSVKVVHRREVPTSATSASSKPRLPEPSQSKHERSLSAVSGTGFSDGTQALPVHSQGRSPDSPLRSNLDAARSAGRSSAPSKSVANDDFIAPRQPPAPPAVRDARKASIASLPSDPTSPVRSHLSPSGLASEFNMDDEMSRIMRPDGRKESIAGESNSSVLRRVSNAMRHKRSHSDRVAGQTHRKTSSVGQVDIGGPYNTNVSMSPALSYMSKDDVALRAQLQTAQLRIADLEAEKQSLQEKLDSSASMTNFNSELREKRSTMAYLDTQREVAVRELETIATHLTRAKDTNQPFDIASLKNDVLHDLSQSLQRLKEQVSTHIEDLIHRRNELTDEITDLIQVKDKGLQEFESLSSKNNQLNDLNAQLAQSIQDSYKVTRTPANGTQVGLFNGLGINNGHRPSDASSFAIETRPHLASRGSNESPTSHMANHDTPELGEAQVLSAPQVVNIRKGQPKRFNWKKGSRDVAKNVTKGLKGAFAPRENEPTNGGLYHTSQPYQVGSLPSDSGSLKSSQISEPGKASATSMAFFQKSGLKQSSLGGAAKSTSTANLVTHEPSGMYLCVSIPFATTNNIVLFGSELAARCEFENRLIPAVVTRCIQEVEARGMDVEGIYRKSGGTGQVQKIQAGFDRDPSGFDISDPDLDIHAVTSCLKQYFRKLPNPLITFEVYDSMLATDDIQDTERKCLALRAAVDSLPQAHRDVLELLIHHLVNVIAQQTTNLVCCFFSRDDRFMN